MKKSLIALAVLAASGAAFAQSSVTMYGVVDVGVLNNGTTTNFNGGGTNGTSRIGFKGVEDLGGGLKGSFQVETGLNSGAETATSIGNRGAFFGLSGSFGTVTLGSSVLSPSFWARAMTDTSTANNYSNAQFGGATRNDNSINYTSNSINGLTLRAAMVLKGDNGGSKASTDVSAVYAAGPLTVSAASSNTGTLKGSSVGAAYSLGVASVFVNQVVLPRTSSAVADTKFNSVGVSAQAGAVTVQADYRKTVGNASADNYVVSAQYPLSARTGLTAFVSKTEGTAAASGFGIRHNF